MDWLSESVIAGLWLVGPPVIVALSLLTFFLIEDHKKAKEMKRRQSEAELQRDLEARVPAISKARVKSGRGARQEKKKGRVRWV